MSRPDTLMMPKAGSLKIADAVAVEASTSIVIVGANGSGKSRLGSWLEFTGPQKHYVYRIGARKSLRFPDTVRPTSIEDAELALLYGVDLSDIPAFKAELLKDHTQAKVYSRHKKWRQNPEINSLIDFVQLLTLLFSYEYEASTDYRNKAKLTTEQDPPFSTKLDLVKKIWELVLPHRKLIIGLGSVSAKPAQEDDSASYHAGELSDGERVIFYLIGKCLVAKPGSIIVIDEPELHVHRAIQACLWEAIERECSGCLFVYLTHNLDFAASRTETQKIWLKSFDGQAWDWKLIPPEQEGLPEEVLLAVLGSRKPVLFVEGGKDSLDRAILASIYPDWTIMPREGCEKVIEATKAFRDLKYLHGLECVGIIDRDYRSPAQQADLRAKGIYVLDIQEMENLLLVETVLQAVAAHPHVRTMTDNTAVDIVQKVKEFAFTTLQRDIIPLALSKTAWELEENLHKIERQVKSVAELEKVRDKAAQFNIAGIYADFEQKLQQIINTKDYSTLLQLYNNKGLAKQVGKYFGQPSYPDLIRRIISGGEGEAITVALRAAAPQLPMAPAQLASQ